MVRRFSHGRIHPSDSYATKDRTEHHVFPHRPFLICPAPTLIGETESPPTSASVTDPRLAIADHQNLDPFLKTVLIAAIIEMALLNCTH